MVPSGKTVFSLPSGSKYLTVWSGNTISLLPPGCRFSVTERDIIGKKDFTMSCSQIPRRLYNLDQDLVGWRYEKTLGTSFILQCLYCTVNQLYSGCLCDLNLQ